MAAISKGWHPPVGGATKFATTGVEDARSQRSHAVVRDRLFDGESIRTFNVEREDDLARWVELQVSLLDDLDVAIKRGTATNFKVTQCDDKVAVSRNSE